MTSAALRGMLVRFAIGLLVSVGLLCSESGAAATATSKDLLPAARAALHGYMAKSVASIPGRPEMVRANYYSKALPKPMLKDDQWDWGDCGARAVEAWIYMREMTGERAFGVAIEQGLVNSLMHVLAPETGMAYVPELSRPAEKDYYYEMWDQGRTLRALVTLWRSQKTDSGKRLARERIDRMIAGLSLTATRGVDPKHSAYAIYPPDAGRNRPRNTCPLPGAGQLIEPLAEYWAATGSVPARRFLDELVAGALSGREGRDSLFNEDGSFYGHFHGHAATALGIGRFGKALYVRGERRRGMELLRWSKKVYDWATSASNVHGGSSWGWFPENTGCDYLQVKEYAEVCCVADMVEYAAFLAACAGLHPSLQQWDGLWDHVERFTLNGILSTQFRVDRYYMAALRASVSRNRVCNEYITFEQDESGCFSHEAVGHQTLEGQGTGRISQLVYSVAYDDLKASFLYQSGGGIASDGFVVDSVESTADRPRSLVRTADAALLIDSSAECGDGPYVLRTFVLTNVSGRILRDVRLSCTINPDTRSYDSDVAEVGNDGSIVVHSADGQDWVGLRGQPAADYLSVGEAVELLRHDGLSWQNPEGLYKGNGGGRLGWRLGDMNAGEKRTITITLAAAKTEEELTKSLSHFKYPMKPASADPLQNDLATAYRLDGGWVALFMPGELFCRNGGMEIYTGGCCSYSGSRALYACWKSAVADFGGTAYVRIPVCRRSVVLDQDVTEGAGVVRQRITLNMSRKLSVRIPDWADIRRVQVSNSKGARLSFDRSGRWLHLARAGAGSRFTISYPLVKTEVSDAVGGAGKSMGFSPVAEQRTYTVVYSGNRVVRITPASSVLPVFRP